MPVTCSRRPCPETGLRYECAYDHPKPGTQLETRPYLMLSRAWGEYARLREERARLKVLVAHQLYGLCPECLRVWADLLQPGALAVLRTGLTPRGIYVMAP